MMEELQRLLATFTEAHGVSGHEEDISRLVAEELAPLVDDVKVDTMGNVIGVRRGDGPSVMMAAHMDEIGLIVKYIDDDGYLRFTTLGGWFDQTLLSQRVVVHGEKGSVPGVIGSKPPHMLEPEERKKVIKIKDMFVDVGAQDADQAAELGLEVGSTITLEQELTPMAADLVCGKSFDDRAGIVMMISALQRVRDEDLKATISAVGTVQEEVGLKGARTSAYAISPDVALVTEVTPAGAHPGVSREQRHIAVGAGPTITVVDSSGRGVIVPKSVLSWLRSSADCNVPLLPGHTWVGPGGGYFSHQCYVRGDGVRAGARTLQPYLLLNSAHSADCGFEVFIPDSLQGRDHHDDTCAIIETLATHQICSHGRELLLQRYGGTDLQPEFGRLVGVLRSNVHEHVLNLDYFLALFRLEHMGGFGADHTWNGTLFPMDDDAL